MKPNLTKLTAVLALALPAAIQAQTSPATTNAAPADASAVVKPVARPSAGLVNDWLREQSPAFTPWDIGGQFRARWEHKENFAAPGQAGQVDFRNKGGDGDNSYLLLRDTVHLGYKSDWFGAFIEGRDSSSTGDDRNPNLESNTFDLHQGYVTFGNQAEFPLTAKVGRQEMWYGEERLVGAFDWNNIGRSFDTAKLRYATQDFWVDAFYSRVVVPDDNNFDMSNEYDNFSGVYASTTALIPRQETQLYFFSRNTEKGSPNLQIGALTPLPSPRDIYTIGFHLKSLPGQLFGFDYTAEAAYQFGRYVQVAGTTPTATIGKSLDQEAYAGHLDGGYTWSKVWGSPRLGLEFNYASGDDNPNDNTHGTFDQMYPTGHRFSGIMDMYTWENIIDARVNLTLKPCPKVTLTSSFRGIWLASTEDAFYQANTAARTGTAGSGTSYGINPGYGSYVGSELDLILNYAITPYLSVQGGYGHFFVGDYVKESLSSPAAGSTDANYVYVQTLFNF